MSETSQFYEYRGGVLVPVPIAAGGGGGDGGAGGGASCDCLEQIRDANSEISQALSSRVEEVVTTRFGSGETGVNIAGAIARTGARGSLAGYETAASSASGNQTITKDSPDCVNINTSGAITMTFTPADADVYAVKTIHLHAEAETALTVSGASWAFYDYTQPWGTVNSDLVFSACFIYGQVILAVYHNSLG